MVFYLDKEFKSNYSYLLHLEEDNQIIPSNNIQAFQSAESFRYYHSPFHSK